VNESDVPGGGPPDAGHPPARTGAGHDEGDAGPLTRAGVACRTSDMWRWRESNPRPTVQNQSFSERSPLCFSQPRQSRGQAAYGLSHCLVSHRAPWPRLVV